MRGIVKQYPLVRAIDGADFTVEQGEIHSLLGENGAGKSTLMKILYGMTTPTAGEVRVFGKPVAITRPAQAIALGIGMVHQHFMLTPVMTVAENVVIGSEPVRGVFFDRKKAEAQVAAMIDEYNFHISATAKVETLSVGEQQRVEILKALYRGADLLILDEPTAVLTPQEVEDLFRVMRQLKAAGKSIIIITHKLKETMEIADRVSVLRQGKMIESGVPVAGTTMNELAQMMVGRDVELSVTRRAEQVGEENFSVRGLSLTERGVPILRDVCLSLRKGEILGIAGIEGNGQTELIEVLTGLRRPDHMELFKDGKPLSGNAAAFLAAGVGHVPEDRMTRGLVLEMSIEDNLILGYHRRPAFARRGLRLASAIRRFAEQERTEFAIKAPTCRSGAAPSPAATSRRWSSPGCSAKTPTSSSWPSPPVAWTWAPWSTFTTACWICGTAASPFCSSPPIWTRCAACPTVWRSSTAAGSWPRASRTPGATWRSAC